MNNVILLGAINKPYDLRYTAQGRPMGTVLLAGYYQAPTANGIRSFPWYLRITEFGKIAENNAELSKNASSDHPMLMLAQCKFTTIFDKEDSNGRSLSLVAEATQLITPDAQHEVIVDKGKGPVLVNALNQVLITGRVNRFEARPTLISLGLTVSESHRNQSGGYDAVKHLIPVTIWEDLTEITLQREIQVGSIASIMGTVNNESWGEGEGERSGLKVSARDILQVAKFARNLQPKDDLPPQTINRPSGKSDDLPFS